MRRLAGCLWSPRLALLIVWAFTDYTEAAFPPSSPSFWLLIPGLLFFPLTALAWAFIVHFGHGDDPWWPPAAVTALALFELGLLSRWFRGAKGKKEKGGG